MHEPAIDELVDHALPQMLDVHRPARAPVEQPLLQLGGARAVRAPPVRLPLGAEGDTLAGRAPRRELPGHRVGRAAGLDHLHDVRDDVAGALDQDRVADPDVLAADLVLVVEADVADHDPGELHRLELRAGREHARLADVDRDRAHDRGGLAGGELERDRPPRVVRRRAEPALLLERVHLDDGAVGLVRERVALGLEPRAVRDHRLDVGRARGARARREPACSERFERLPVRGDERLVARAHVVEQDVERAARGHLGVLLPDGAGGGVARVGEGGLAVLLELPVQLVKLLARHEHLPADLELAHGGERGA